MIFDPSFFINNISALILNKNVMTVYAIEDLYLLYQT